MAARNSPGLDMEATQTGSGPRATFVVRVWTDDGSETSESVRGHILHVRSRRRAYFATRQRLLTFIQEHLGDAGSTQCQS